MEASNLLADQAGFEVCRRFVVARNPARTDHASSSVAMSWSAPLATRFETRIRLRPGEEPA